jgi:dimethylaniline monooxygenase (N-oxide forming)
VNNQKVAVIGAGPCGLTACKTLADYGLDYECLEASDAIGGIWNVERGHSGGYRSLQTNTSIASMSFSDFAFEQDTPTYPNAKQMLGYFKSYAEHNRLGESIRFNSRIARACPVTDGSWQLEFDSGETRNYSSLVVASGQYVRPRLPHLATAGEFSGQQLHVIDYLDVATPIDMRGKRVIVVGLGSSAAELAAELCDPNASADCASQVILSARTGRWVLPKITDGKPLDSRSPHPSARLPTVIRALPGDFGEWLARRLMSKALRTLSASFGGAQTLGLPEPEMQPWQDRPTMSIGFIPALQAGRIDVRPGITCFSGNTVHFNDGSQTEADIILYATGYQLDFPFLDTETLGCEASELALYQRISHPVHDRLFFVGCCRVMCSMWPLAEQQSRWVASLLAGKFKLPSAAHRSSNATELARSLPVMCNFYVERLRKEARGF